MGTRKDSKNNRPSLVKEILSDIFIKHWIMSCLALLLIMTAMLQAKTSHEIRKAVADWQSLKEENQQLQIVWQELRLEITSLSEADRISRLAREQLDMIEVTTKNERIISL